MYLQTKQIALWLGIILFNVKHFLAILGVHQALDEYTEGSTWFTR